MHGGPPAYHDGGSLSLDKSKWKEPFRDNCETRDRVMCSVIVGSKTLAKTTSAPSQGSSSAASMSNMVTKGEHSDLEQASPPDTPPSEAEEDVQHFGSARVKDMVASDDPESPHTAHSRLEYKSKLPGDDHDSNNGQDDDSSQGEDESRDHIPPSSILSGHGAFRVITNRQLTPRLVQPRAPDHSDTEDNSPLDFTSKHGSELDANDNSSSRKRTLEEYFLPFKRLGLGQNHEEDLDKTSNRDDIHDEANTSQSGEDEDDNLASKKKRRGVQSFSINDILSHKTAELERQQKRLHEQQQLHQHFQSHNPFNPVSVPQAIVRPWDIGSAAVVAAAAARMADHSERAASGSSKVLADGGHGGISNSDRRKSAGDSPLDALFQMASKTFEGLKAKSELDPSQLSFSAKQPPKKKRKSRTAFTNHQIFELEKRFLYQKYLSPADRDEIAAALGLSNAQVITWFQNRRAKLKRDMEELRKDVECTSVVLPHPSSVVAGHQQMAAAVAALASRSLSAIPGGHKLGHPSPLNLHQSPPSSRESLMSPRSPMISEGSPPIRIGPQSGRWRWIYPMD